MNVKARTASSIQRERLFQINTRANLLAVAAAEMNCLSGLTFSEESRWCLQLEFTFLSLHCLFFECLSLCKHFQLLFNLKWNPSQARTRALAPSLQPMSGSDAQSMPHHPLMVNCKPERRKCCERSSCCRDGRSLCCSVKLLGPGAHAGQAWPPLRAAERRVGLKFVTKPAAELLQQVEAIFSRRITGCS